MARASPSNVPRDVIPRVASLAGDDLAEASSYDDDAPPLPEWLPPKTCPDCGSSVVRAPLSASKTAMGSIVPMHGRSQVSFAIHGTFTSACTVPETRSTSEVWREERSRPQSIARAS